MNKFFDLDKYSWLKKQEIETRDYDNKWKIKNPSKDIKSIHMLGDNSYKTIYVNS